jgi:hypothetical protein
MSYIGSYGTAVTGPTADTDLGLIFANQGPLITSISPAKGMISTIDTAVAGSGYKIGKGKELIQSSTTGTGAGLSCIADIVEVGGILKVGATVNLTAGFMNYQNDKLLKLDVANLEYTWVRTTATGEPMPDVLAGPVTTTEITSTGGSGTAATFLVSVNNGTVTNVIVRAAGSGYKVGDIIILTIANLQAAMNVANGTEAVVMLGDIKLLLTEENVYGGIDVSTIKVLNGGSGNVVADVITLTEEGSLDTGTGTVAVATLSPAYNVGEATFQVYPAAFKTATAGAVEFKGMDDAQVVISGLVIGEVIPLSFKEITAAGTSVTLDTATIFYK